MLFLLSRLQFAYFQEIQALEKVAPAIKVIVWEFVFLALGSQRPFWQPEAFLGAFLSRFGFAD